MAAAARLGLQSRAVSLHERRILRRRRMGTAPIASAVKPTSIDRNDDAVADADANDLDNRRRRKRFTLVRHGVTRMNEFLSKKPYGSPGFVDPLDFDTRLTKRGEEQARSLQRKTAELFSKRSSSPSSIAVVVSPLTRALQTATLAFPWLVDEWRTGNPTMTSLALARERVWLSSDVGRPRSLLSSEFPHVCFGDLPSCDSPWWHGGHAATLEGGSKVELEPLGAFRGRVAELREKLLSFEDEEVVLVSHAGVLETLTGGRFFHNCEMVSVTGEELMRVDLGTEVGEEEEGEGFLF